MVPRSRLRPYASGIRPVRIRVLARGHVVDPYPVRGRHLNHHSLSEGGIAVEKTLTDRFAMTDMGEISLVLGMTATGDFDKGTLTTSQEDYLQNAPIIQAQTIERAAGEKRLARDGALPGYRGVATLPRLTNSQPRGVSPPRLI